MRRRRSNCQTMRYEKPELGGKALPRTHGRSELDCGRERVELDGGSRHSMRIAQVVVPREIAVTDNL